jgi:hypothetical protein
VEIYEKWLGHYSTPHYASILESFISRGRLAIHPINSASRQKRRRFNTLAAQAEKTLEQDPFSGHLFVFRGRRGDLLKIIW